MDLTFTTQRNVTPLYNKNTCPTSPISTLKSSEPSHQLPKSVPPELQATDVPYTLQTFHCLLCDYRTKDSSLFINHEQTCPQKVLTMTPSPHQTPNTTNGSPLTNGSQSVHHTNHEPPDKPEFPWKDKIPTTPSYPELVTLRLTIQKEPSKVSDKVWPWKRSTAGRYLNVDYFKHLGYGEPPASLPGNQGDLFIDFATPEYPLVYFYNNGWMDYNADHVIANERKEWLGILEHPLFPDRYLWSAEKKGLCWTSHSIFNGSSLACLNDDREEAKGWFTKYLCDSFQMLSIGVRRDMARIPDSPASQSKQTEEIQRRARIYIPRSPPKPTPPFSSASSSSRRTSHRQVTEVAKPRRQSSLHRSKTLPVTSTLTGDSISAPPKQPQRDRTPKKKKPSISISSRTPTTISARSPPLTPLPSTPLQDPQYEITQPPILPSYDMDVDPSPPVFQALAPTDMEVDKDSPSRQSTVISDDPELDETLDRVQQILEERKRQHQKHLGALQTIKKLRRELQQADEARVFAEQRAAEAELELETLKTEGWKLQIDDEHDDLDDSNNTHQQELEDLRIKLEKIRIGYEKQAQELSEAREEAARLRAESETTREAVAKLKIILAADDDDDGE